MIPGLHSADFVATPSPKVKVTPGGRVLIHDNAAPNGELDLWLEDAHTARRWLDALAYAANLLEIKAHKRRGAHNRVQADREGWDHLATCSYWEEGTCDSGCEEATG